MIRLEKLSKSYRVGAVTVPALVDVDLTVQRGQIFGVIGSSGAGKSTLIRCVNLLERPTCGRVIVDGHDLTALDTRALAERRRSIGMVFQQPNLLASRTVAGNVALPLELAGVPSARIRERVTELLSVVGISDKRDARPAQLSGGQRQRATIARALANQPKVLLSDEATSALDPATTHSILRLLRDINRRLGITVLLITHEMDVVKSVCDQVAILSEGRVIEQGSVDELFARARTELGQAFVRSSRHLELPAEYGARLSPVAVAGSHPLLRIELRGDASSALLISRLSRREQIEVAILSARTDHTDGGSFGVMLLELRGDEAAATRSIAYLRAQHAEVELLGHVVGQVVEHA